MTKKKPEKNTPNVAKTGEPDPLDEFKKVPKDKEMSNSKMSEPFRGFVPSKTQMNIVALCSVIMGSQKGALWMFYTMTGLILVFYSFESI